MPNLTELAAIAAPLGPLVGWLAARKRNSADVTKVLTDAAAVATKTTTDLLGGLKTEFTEMKKEFTDYKAETKARAKKHVEEFDIPLVREFRQMGGNPPDPVPLFD